MNEAESNRREEIIQAALRVFGRQGFHKASIKQIASEAGLKSPSLIYWYFKDKDELLHAVITHLLPIINQIVNPGVMMDMPPEDFLRMISSAYFTVFANPGVIRVFRIVLSEAAHAPDSLPPAVQHNMLMLLNFLASYFQHQIEVGQLKPHNPLVSARAFMGTLLIYVMGREIIPPLGVDLPDITKYQAEIIRIFLDGLRPA